MGEEPGSNLPAPYVNPWSLLLRDLKAVLASLGLSLREIVRRNRDGSLPRPALWPQDLAPLFWPVVLLLPVLLAIGLLLLRPARPQGAAVPEAPIPRPEAAADPLKDPLEPRPDAPEAPIGVLNDTEAMAPASPGAPATPEPEAAEVPTASGSVAPSAPEPPPSRELLLLAQLMQPETDGLLLAVREDPEGLRINLILSPSFRDRPARLQERLAADWLEQVKALGYEQLDLLDPSGERLGRSASIGSGMILFTMAPGA
jgi:hypothetical protein